MESIEKRRKAREDRNEADYAGTVVTDADTKFANSNNELPSMLKASMAADAAVAADLAKRKSEEALAITTSLKAMGKAVKQGEAANTDPSQGTVTEPKKQGATDAASAPGASGKWTPNA